MASAGSNKDEHPEIDTSVPITVTELAAITGAEASLVRTWHARDKIPCIRKHPGLFNADEAVPAVQELLAGAREYRARRAAAEAAD